MPQSWSNLLWSSAANYIGAIAAIMTVAILRVIRRNATTDRGRYYVPLLRSLLPLLAAVVGTVVANFFFVPVACLLIGLIIYGSVSLSLFWPGRFQAASVPAINAFDPSEFKVIEGGIEYRHEKDGTYAVSRFTITPLRHPFAGRKLRIELSGPIALGASEFRFQHGGTIFEAPAGTPELRNMETVVIAFSSREMNSLGPSLVAKFASNGFQRVTAMGWTT